MWTVEVPACTAAEVAVACSKSIRDRDLRSRVLASVAMLKENNEAYRRLAHQDRLHEVASERVPVDNLSSLELKDLYKKQLANAKSKAHPFYQEIIGRALHGLCSYCLYGQADTLDHFVPKATVPELSIDPFNLIPCCSRCNHKLLAAYAASAAQQMLHPYIPVDVGRWLRADLDQAASGVIRFYADPPSSLPIMLRRRVIHQFEALALDELYAIVSAQEMSGLRRTLNNNFSHSDQTGVSDHLRDISKQAFDVDKNNRRGAMYEALADNAWYCSGGFSTTAA